MAGTADDPIAELLTTYNELNGSTIEELHQEPSPLEFMRYVAKNTPFVVRRAAKGWQASRTWSAAYLKEALADETVNVAVTPMGLKSSNADSPTRMEGSGELVFAKPWEEDQPFPEFLDFVIAQENEVAASTPSEIRYAQTQNDNFRHEYVSLFAHVQPDIPFARIALDRDPEAINLWIGNSRSVTALHKDNYENIYVQVLGRKHFVLMPPLCQPCVNEQPLKPATYVRRGGNDDAGLELKLDSVGEGEGEGEGGGDGNVPFATWDPDTSGPNETAYSKLAEPMRVTLDPGDMLYLPAMWYHKVSQSCLDDDICVAVNYWYDMDFSGPLYPMCNFVRSTYMSQS